MNKTQARNLLDIILIVIIILLLLPPCNTKPKKDKPEYWEKKGFKTKITIVHDTLKLPGKPYGVKVPPIEIIQWLPNPNNNKLKQKNDSLYMVLDSMDRELAQINKNFLLQYPDAHKLVNGEFTLDTIRFDFITTSGLPKTELYPTNYSRFNYRFRNNTMTAEEKPQTPSKPNKEKITSNYYISGGLNTIGLVPAISFDYYLRYKGLQLDAEPKLNIQKNPTLEVNVKLGYRIK